MHARHADAPLPFWYSPTGAHAVQPVEPAWPANCPGLQTAQAVALALGWYRPGGQARQKEELLVGW